MKKCSQCGKISDNNFCTDCGGKMVDMPDNDKVEVEAELLNQQEQEIPEVQNEQPMFGEDDISDVQKPKLKKKRIAVIGGIITVVCIALIIVGINRGLGNTYSDFLVDFENYLQENFPEEDFSIRFEENYFWIYCGDDRVPDYLFFRYEGESISDEDKEMHEKARSICLAGSFLENDSTVSAKIFGGFLDYLSKDIDDGEKGAKILIEMIDEYKAEQGSVVRKVDNGKVYLPYIDFENNIITIVYAVDK